MSKELDQGDHQKPQGTKQGHCSQCGKVWTLAEAQGVCQWCGKSAICQSAAAKPRKVKTSRRKRAPVPTIGKDYERLLEPHLSFYNVALPFAKGVPAQDQEDLLHAIISNLADADRNGHKPDNPSWMYRIASFTKAQYWRTYYKLTNGLDCGHCSKAQKQKCHDDDLYSQCPKLIKIESLNKPILDSEGNLTELGELIADDKALDLDGWVSDSTWEIGYKPRLVDIAYKLDRGEALTQVERNYLCRFREREQKKLF